MLIFSSYHFHGFQPSVVNASSIQQARLKFELTNQDSNGGAGVNLCQQEMHCNRFSLGFEFEVELHFSSNKR